MRPNFRYKMHALYVELAKYDAVELMIRDIFLFRLIIEEWYWWGEIWNNSAISKSRKRQLLKTCLPNVFSPMFSRLLQILTDNEDTPWFNNIIDSFLDEVKRVENCEFIGVYTPKLLNFETMQKISQSISLRTGTKVYAYQSIEPKLLDGFRVSFQGKMIDLSGRHVLNKMKAYLAEA